MGTYVLDALAVLTAEATGPSVNVQMDIGVGDDVGQVGDALRQFHTIT